MSKKEVLYIDNVKVQENPGLKTFKVLKGVTEDPTSGMLSFYTRVMDLPFDLSLEPNAREGHTDTPLSREIRKTLTEEGEKYVLKQGGPVITCQSVVYDPKTGIVHAELRNVDGLLDNGSSYRNLQKVAIKNRRDLLIYRGNPKSDPEKVAALEEAEAEMNKAHVLVTLIPGLSSGLVREVSAARNSHNHVATKSNMDALGIFDPMKKALPVEVVNRVLFHENQLEVNEIERDIRVERLAKACYVLNRKDLTDPDRHEIYGGKYLSHLKERYKSEGYMETYPLLERALLAYEAVAMEISSRMRESKDGSATLTGVQRAKKDFKLPLSEKKPAWDVPECYVWPILGTLRNLIDGQGGWSVDPVTFIQTHGRRLVAELLVIYDGGEVKTDPSNFGKSATVWRSLDREGRLMLAGLAA